MIPFHPSLPDIIRRKPIKFYSIGEYNAVLVDDVWPIAATTPELRAMAPHYLFALAISRGTDLVEILAAEQVAGGLNAIMMQAARSSGLIEELEAEAAAEGKSVEELMGASTALRVFSEDGGAANHGQLPSPIDGEAFALTAIDLFRRRHRLTDPVFEHRPGAGAQLKSWFRRLMGG